MMNSWFPSATSNLLLNLIILLLKPLISEQQESFHLVSVLPGMNLSVLWNSFYFLAFDVLSLFCILPAPDLQSDTLVRRTKSFQWGGMVLEVMIWVLHMFTATRESLCLILLKNSQKNMHVYTNAHVPYTHMLQNSQQYCQSIPHRLLYFLILYLYVLFPVWEVKLLNISIHLKIH